MVRKRKTEGNNTDNIVDLAEGIGLTLLSNAENANVDNYLPLRVPNLDSIYMVPFSRVTEIYGLNASGKSSLALNIASEAQKYDVPVVFIDIEGTMVEENMINYGIDPDKVFMVEPEPGEVLTIEDVTAKMKEVIELFTKVDRPAVVVWDSLASTATQTELKDGFNPNQMGVKAKAIANMTIQIGQSIANTNLAFIILNQARDDLKANPMFPQIKSTGGRAMEHWASVRLEVAKASQIKEKRKTVDGKDKDEYIGHIFRVKTKKSKLTTPNKQAEVYLISDPYVGIDFIQNVYRTAVDHYSLISKGAWRIYKTHAGEEVKLRDKEWVPYLQSDEGLPVLTELYLSELVAYFPEWFAPLSNVDVDVTKDYFLNIAKKMYEGEDISEYTTMKGKGEDIYTVPSKREAQPETEVDTNAE